MVELGEVMVSVWVVWEGFWLVDVCLFGFEFVFEGVEEGTTEGTEAGRRVLEASERESTTKYFMALKKNLFSSS